MYTQLAFVLSRLAELAPQHPDWKTSEPFKSTLAGDLAAFANFTMADLETLVAASHAGMSTDNFSDHRRRLAGSGVASTLETPVHQSSV